MRSNTQKITRIALLAALALVLGFIESNIPLPVTIPGVKLGMANVVVLVAIYLIDRRTAFGLMLFKVAVTAFISGSLMSIAYSLAGGLLAYIIIALLKGGDRVNIIVVSMAAAIAHNVAQVLVAAWLLETPALLLNLPFLAIVACITGAATGTVAKGVLAAIQSSH